MATYRQVARICGCSKQHVYQVARSLDPAGAHITRKGNADVLDDWLTSAVSAEVTRRRQEGAKEAAPGLELLVQADEATADALRAAHEAEMAALRARLDAERMAHADVVAEKDARIADLRDLLDAHRVDAERLRAELSDVRRQLDMAKELQGFKWPWQRRAILERYSLPPAGGNE